MRRRSPTAFLAAAMLGGLLACVVSRVDLSRKVAMSNPVDTAEMAVAADQTDEEASDEKPARHRHTVSFKRLSHDIVVNKTPLSKRELKDDLHSFRGAVRSIEKRGYRVGVLIKDIGTGATLDYGANLDFYPASSIKGPYTCCIFEEMVDTGQLDPDTAFSYAEPIIVGSDNEAYHELCERCGTNVFADWAVKHGVIKAGSPAYDRFVSRYYPHVTPRQMVRLWDHIIDYLYDEVHYGGRLSELFERRDVSPLRDGLDPSFRVISKAGWYDTTDDFDAVPATCEAGIVHEGPHTYIVALMTDMPADLEELTKLVPDLMSATSVL